jgi:L-rhamnonate dehydratase
MKITKVSATTHRLPVKVPLLDKPINREIVFVRVESDEGITGYGMAGPILRFATREFINTELGPFVVGMDPLATERVWNLAYWQFNQRSLSGAVMNGMAALDIALWDLKGKFLRQPVWRLLGGNAQTVPAYITFGLLEYSREQLAEAARMLVKQGHDKLKLVVAINDAQDPKEDAARMGVVRDAVGPDVQLMMDANHLFTPLNALDLCRRCEELDITWFEEPLMGNDALSLAELRTKTKIPISAGQNEGHRWRHRELMLARAIDICQPNVVYVGGYTEALKVAHMAQAFNLPVANGGGWPHHNAHLIAAVPNGWRVEFHIPMWYTGNTFFKDPPQPVRGTVTLTDRPGLGMEPNEEALREYQEKRELVPA